MNKNVEVVGAAADDIADTFFVDVFAANRILSVDKAKMMAAIFEGRLQNHLQKKIVWRPK